MGAMKRNLVVVRCGATSLHREWLGGGERTWDLVLCPYQPVETDGLPSVLIPGQKWRGLYQYFLDNQEWNQYQYIWLPDDDLLATPAAIDRFFDLCGRFAVDLAAPALSADSHFFHVITMANQRCRWRRTTFVEIMMPCFSARFLQRALPTFALSPSGLGHGMDFLWPCMLDYQGVGIFDEVTVRHTRPVGGALDPAMAAACGRDVRFVTHDLAVPVLRKTIAAGCTEGLVIGADDALFKERYLGGYRYLADRAPDLADQLEAAQSRPVPALPQHHPLRYLDFHLRHAAVAGLSLARGRPSLVSSVSQWSRSQDPAIEAAGGNDGIIDGDHGFHTAHQVAPWWQVDLGEVRGIRTIDIYNRLAFKQRCVRFAILVSNDAENWTAVAAKQDDAEFGGADGRPCVCVFPQPVRARYVRVQLIGEGVLHLDQIEIFDDCPERAALGLRR